jgi:hypothetical protein
MGVGQYMQKDVRVGMYQICGAGDASQSLARPARGAGGHL